MPILELDDGTVLIETLPIIEYLEELYPNPPLIGNNPVRRALVRSWERRCEIGVYLTASRMVLSKGAVSEQARKILTHRLPLVDAGLEGKEWLAGDFSIADIMLLIGLDTAHHGDTFRLDSGLHNLANWYERVKARPSSAV